MGTDRNITDSLGAIALPADDAQSRESYGRLVSYLARRYHTYLDTVVAPYGISSSHVALLSYLWDGRSGDTQNEIARYLGVDKGTVSRNVASLVKRGLVSQTPSARDSRACVVELTEAGWALAEPVNALAALWSDGIAEGLSDDDCSRVSSDLTVMCRRADRLASAAHTYIPHVMQTMAQSSGTANFGSTL